MSNKKKGPPPEPKKQGKKNQQSSKEEGLVVEGVVTESLKGRFRIEIQHENQEEGGPKHEVLGHLAGKLRRFGIKIVPGDKVSVELSPYDITRGRIVYRLKK